MKTKIAEALVNFQKNMPEVKLDSTVRVKTAKGEAYSFKYATLQNIMKVVLPKLAENGLSITQTFVDEKLKTTLLHTSGERIVSIIPIDLHTGDMQKIGSRISYLKRYSISAILGIVAEEDDDANIADGNEFKKTKAQAAQKSTRKAAAEKKVPCTKSQNAALYAKTSELVKDGKMNKDEAKDFRDWLKTEYEVTTDDEGNKRFTKSGASKLIDEFDTAFQRFSEQYLTPLEELPPSAAD